MQTKSILPTENTMNRIANNVLLSAALALFTATSLAPNSAAQSPAGQTSVTNSDQSSLADYARKARKDPAAKAKPKVFDNDNIPKDDKLSVVGEAQPPEPPTAADSTAKATTPADEKDAAAKPAATAPATTEVKLEDEDAKNQAEWKQWQERLKAQKDAIDLSSRELDVLQKEYQLRAAAMYADVGNRLRNQAAWDKQDADYKQKISDKEKAVEDAKQALDDMEEQARKAGVPANMRE